MNVFLKGIVTGLGAIAPGLSGSVLLVIFGLYQKTINAINTIFKNFVKNMKFLIPLVLGIGVGVVIFSKAINFLLATFEMQTRFAFLGLILGSIPLFFREVKKEGFSKRYYILVAISLALGILLFSFNKELFPVIVKPSILQSAVLGLCVATSYIIPGVDSAAILSALGMYDLWVRSLATLDFYVLIPALVGAAIGVILISKLISFLIKKCYTITFSIIFGLFLSVVPRVLNESCVLALDVKTFVSFGMLILGFLASLIFSNVEELKNKNQSKV